VRPFDKIIEGLKNRLCADGNAPAFREFTGFRGFSEMLKVVLLHRLHEGRPRRQDYLLSG
jgi:hypothetical protein